MTYDPISPGHYKDGKKYETIEVIEDWGLNFNLGNVVKYIGRNGLKPGEDQIEGLKKAAFYLNREICKLEKSTAQNRVTTSTNYEDVIYFGQLNYSLDGDFVGQAEWSSLCDI